MLNKAKIDLFNDGLYGIMDDVTMTSYESMVLANRIVIEYKKMAISNEELFQVGIDKTVVYRGNIYNAILAKFNDFRDINYLVARVDNWRSLNISIPLIFEQYVKKPHEMFDEFRKYVRPNIHSRMVVN